jgi:hypothetical protein
LVNPGSLGGLGAASPQASYALWEDGHLQLKRYSYPLRNTVEENSENAGLSVSARAIDRVFYDRRCGGRKSLSMAEIRKPDA